MLTASLTTADGRHPIQMQELKDRASQDIEDLGVQSRHGTAAELRDDVVERALPSERAGDDLSREGSIAFVWQPRTGAREGMGQVGTFRRHRAQRFVRRFARRRDHPRSTFVPGPR